MTLGEKIAKQRKELNYTQEQLADILGVSRQSISKWESGVAYPETGKLVKMGKIFDCSMDYLLNEEITEKQSTAPRERETLWDKIKNNFMNGRVKKWYAVCLFTILVATLTASLPLDLRRGACSP